MEGQNAWRLVYLIGEEVGSYLTIMKYTYYARMGSTYSLVKIYIPQEILSQEQV